MKTFKILFVFFVLGVPFKSYAWITGEPIHLRCSSYPLCAAKVYAVCSKNYYDYDSYIYYVLSNKEKLVSAEEYFNIFVKEEDYASTIDVKIAATNTAGYMVRIIPIDDGYSFVGLSRSQFTGEVVDWRQIWNTSNYNGNPIDYYRQDVEESDFVFDPERIMTTIYQQELEKNIFVVHMESLIGGYFRDDWLVTTDGITEFVGDPNCFPENPNEYLYAVFARVVISNFKEKEVYLYPRANEIGDEVTLTCTRDDFDYWIEEGTGRHIAENPYTFTVTGKETYTAHFADPSKIASHQLPSGKEGSSLYDLSGRRVANSSEFQGSSFKLPKGVYIQNEKKVVIK